MSLVEGKRECRCLRIMKVSPAIASQWRAAKPNTVLAVALADDPPTTNTSNNSNNSKNASKAKSVPSRSSAPSKASSGLNRTVSNLTAAAAAAAGGGGGGRGETNHEFSKFAVLDGGILRNLQFNSTSAVCEYSNTYLFQSSKKKQQQQQQPFNVASSPSSPATAAAIMNVNENISSNKNQKSNCFSPGNSKYREIVLESGGGVDSNSSNIQCDNDEQILVVGKLTESKSLTPSFDENYRILLKSKCRQITHPDHRTLLALEAPDESRSESLFKYYDNSLDNDNDVDGDDTRGFATGRSGNTTVASRERRQMDVMTLDQVKEFIFKIFESSGNDGVLLKDFQSKLKVPQSQLKAALDELGDCAARNGQRMKWYLKPEFNINP